jgi:signal transduction histidine kinase
MKNRLNSLSLATKALMLLVVIFLSFFAFLYMSYEHTKESEQAVRSMKDNFFPASELLSDNLRNLDKLEETIQSAVASGEKEPIDDSASLRDKTVQVYEKLKAINGDRDYEILEEQFKEYYAYLIATSKAMLELGYSQADTASLSAMNQKAKKYREKLLQKKESKKTELETLLSEKNEKYKSFITSTFFVMVLIFVVVLVATTALLGTILNKIKLANKSIKAIVVEDSHNLLGKRLEFSQNDEIGEFSLWFNKLMDKVESLFESLAEANAQISVLLNNSDEGFLTFGSDFLIEGHYSIECEKMLGSFIFEARIETLLYPNNKYDQNRFVEMLNFVFDSCDNDKIEMFLSIFPKEVRIDGKYLSVRYKALEAKHIMLILNDITQEKELQERVEQEQKRLKFVVNSLKNRDEVLESVEEFRRFLDEIKSLSSFEEAYRAIHTFKGTFAEYDFYYLPKELHECESNLSRATSHGESDSFLTLIETCIPALKSNLESDLKALGEALGEEFFESSDAIFINKNEIYQIEAKVKSIISSQADRMEMSVDAMEVLKFFKEVHYKPFAEMLHAYPKIVEQLAVRLEKEVAPLKIEGGAFKVDPQRFGSFMKSLVHVFRNALDHGVETPDERVDAGKEEVATLSCKAVLQDGWVMLEISDDGRGIDEEKLKAKAEELGVIFYSSPLELVFEDSLSTKDEVSEISGRGVGLSALKAQVEKLGGRIEIDTQAGRGTTFRFVMAQ